MKVPKEKHRKLAKEIAVLMKRPNTKVVPNWSAKRKFNVLEADLGLLNALRFVTGSYNGRVNNNKQNKNKQ